MTNIRRSLTIAFMENKAVIMACEIIGNQAKLARLLKLKPPTVNQWVTGVRQVPAEQCPEIEKATDGAVTCEELRPDVDWAYLRGTTCQEDHRTCDRRQEDRRQKSLEQNNIE